VFVGRRTAGGRAHMCLNVQSLTLHLYTASRLHAGPFTAQVTSSQRINPHIVTTWAWWWRTVPTAAATRRRRRPLARQTTTWTAQFQTWWTELNWTELNWNFSAVRLRLRSVPSDRTELNWTASCQLHSVNFSCAAQTVLGERTGISVHFISVYKATSFQFSSVLLHCTAWSTESVVLWLHMNSAVSDLYRANELNWTEPH